MTPIPICPAASKTELVHIHAVHDVPDEYKDWRRAFHFSTVSYEDVTPPYSTLRRQGNWGIEGTIDELLAGLSLALYEVSVLMSGGQQTIERMLEALLGALGFEHEEDVSAELSKT